MMFLSEESMDKMMFMLLRYENIDVMLEIADELLTEKDELEYICGELYNLAYESKMESGDGTVDKSTDALYEWCENKLHDMSN